jgi:hypothetical protein
MRPYTSELSENKSSWTEKFFVWYQHKNTNYPTHSTLDGVVVF